MKPYPLIAGLILLSALSAHAGFFPVSTTDLDSNQKATVAAINRQYSNPSFFLPGAFFTAPQLGKDLNALPLSQQAAAVNQLSDEKFGVFTSSLAFNNASFDVLATDSYLAGLRNDANGDFLAGNGGIDVSGLTINDANVDPTLAMTHSRLMAWNPGPLSGGLLDEASTAELGGVEMKDSKDMKQMAPAYGDPWNFFVRGNVVLAQGFSQQDVPHFDYNTESGTLGTDYRISPNFLVGLTASYAHTDVTLDTAGSSATVDSYSPGFYAAYANQGWYANLSGNYLHNAYTQTRVIGFIGETAKSDPEGNEGVANLDGGYDFHLGAFKVGPLAGLQYTHLSVDGFTEGGAPLADLTVADQETDSLRSRLGAELSYVFNCHGTHITPHLQAAWQHEFLDQGRGLTSSFNTGGGDFSVRTPNPSRDSALVDAGVDADLNRTVTVFADYQDQAGQDNYFGQAVQAGVKIGF